MSKKVQRQGRKPGKSSESRTHRKPTNMVHSVEALDAAVATRELREVLDDVFLDISATFFELSAQENTAARLCIVVVSAECPWLRRQQFNGARAHMIAVDTRQTLAKLESVSTALSDGPEGAIPLVVIGAGWTAVRFLTDENVAREMRFAVRGPDGEWHVDLRGLFSSVSVAPN